MTQTKLIKNDDGNVYLSPSFSDKIALSQAHVNHATAELSLTKMRIAHDQQAYEVRKMRNEVDLGAKHRAQVQLKAEYNQLLKEMAEEAGVPLDKLSYDPESGLLRCMGSDGDTGPLRWSEPEDITT